MTDQNLPTVFTKQRIAQNGIVELLKHFPENQYHLATSCKTITHIPDGHKVIIRYVHINPDPEQEDVYPTPNKSGYVSLGSQSAMKIGNINGVRWLRTQIEKERDTNGDLLAITAYVWGEYTDISGQIQPITGSKTLDFKAMAKSNKSISDINSRREFGGERAETGAKARAIRKAFGLKDKYKPEELEKPFVGACLEFDYDIENPVDRQFLLTRSTSAGNLLYGGTPDARQDLNPANEIQQPAENQQAEQAHGQNSYIDNEIDVLMKQTKYRPKTPVTHMDYDTKVRFLEFLKQKAKGENEF